MAARQARGLSAADLDSVRKGLAAGRKPKVVFTEAAGQLAGQSGQIVELTDPRDSSEWVLVRFGRDTLPFSPADLMITPRGGRPGAATSPPGRAGSGRSGAAVSTERADADRGRAAPPPVGVASVRAVSPAEAGGAAVSQAAEPISGQRPVPPRPAADPVGNIEPAAGDRQRVTPDRKPRKAARTKAPAALTVTVAYADGEWTVAATQGTKALARPVPVRATEAVQAVTLLGVPGVQQAVEEIVAAARTDAERAAERLRTELAEVEARLAELPDVPR